MSCHVCRNCISDVAARLSSRACSRTYVRSLSPRSTRLDGELEQEVAGDDAVVVVAEGPLQLVSGVGQLGRALGADRGRQLC